MKTEMPMRAGKGGGWMAREREWMKGKMPSVQRRGRDREGGRARQLKLGCSANEIGHFNGRWRLAGCLRSVFPASARPLVVQRLHSLHSFSRSLVPQDSIPCLSPLRLNVHCGLKSFSIKDRTVLCC